MSVTTSAAKVERELRDRGLTITEAAKLAKLSRPTVRRMVQGRPVAVTSALALSLVLQEREPVVIRLLEAAS